MSGSIKEKDNAFPCSGSTRIVGTLRLRRPGSNRRRHHGGVSEQDVENMDNWRRDVTDSRKLNGDDQANLSGMR